ncbi:MAG TPA: hypothetical protein VGB68_01055 [Pyrinomonadaceae bacterium]|jgi:hypothetical protein
MSESNNVFTVGRKVRIRGECGFAGGVVGMIAYPPKVSVLAEDFGDNYFRKVQTLKGEKAFVWVVFDEPQFDADEDGPYGEAEIDADNLEIIEV